MHSKVQKKPAPMGFGSRVPRFGKMSIHPNLDPTGMFVSRPLGCNPALYSPQDISVAYANIKVVRKDPWRCKVELEDWCKNLGYRNQNILDERKWFAGLLGPAWTEVPEEKKCDPAACKNVGFGRTTRFKKTTFQTPGPGTYYKAVPFKGQIGPHANRPTFEREEPCRFADLEPKWALAPNRYPLIDRESIENKSKKVVSIRGPYELFTGKRDMSTIKNHFSTSGKVFSKTWPLKLEGCLEDLKKKQTGKWKNKTGREWPARHRTAMSFLPSVPRKPSDPAPTTYNVRKEYQFPQYKHGFNSSYDLPPGYLKVGVWPGVGRYRFKPRPCTNVPGNGHKHVFLCKIPRTIGAIIPAPMNAF